MELSIAVEPYDRHLPLLERQWQTPSGVGLHVKAVGQLASHQYGQDRHERFLHGREFDAAELSLSSYLMYRQRHDDVIGLPIFPRRMFTYSNVWVRNDSTATSWRDLRTAAIGVPTFQMSLGVWARHDIVRDEESDWRTMTWVSAQAENVEMAAPVSPLRAPSLFQGLSLGEVDAVLTPELPAQVDLRREFRRLYGTSTKATEVEQVRSRGYVPPVHLIAIDAAVHAKHPELALEMAVVFSEAKAHAWHRYNDPGWGLSFWGRQGLEEQDELIGRMGWADGLTPNRAALQDFCVAAVDQGLIARLPDLDEVFTA